MQYIKLEKDLVTNSYRCEKELIGCMFIIGVFLRSDVGKYSSNFIRWILDKNSIYGGGNLINLEKSYENIIMSDAYSEEFDGGPYVILPEKSFIKMLENWDRIYKQNPKEIHITKDGDNIQITGSS